MLLLSLFNGYFIGMLIMQQELNNINRREIDYQYQNQTAVKRVWHYYAYRNSFYIFILLISFFMFAIYSSKYLIKITNYYLYRHDYFNQNYQRIAITWFTLTISCFITYLIIFLTTLFQKKINLALEIEFGYYIPNVNNCSPPQVSLQSISDNILVCSTPDVISDWNLLYMESTAKFFNRGIYFFGITGSILIILINLIIFSFPSCYPAQLRVPVVHPTLQVIVNNNYQTA